MNGALAGLSQHFLNKFPKHFASTQLFNWADRENLMQMALSKGATQQPQTRPNKASIRQNYNKQLTLNRVV